jgi:hypothetical protein
VYLIKETPPDWIRKKMDENVHIFLKELFSKQEN